MDSHPWYFVSSSRLLLLNCLLFLGHFCVSKENHGHGTFLCVSMEAHILYI